MDNMNCIQYDIYNLCSKYLAITLMHTKFIYFVIYSQHCYCTKWIAVMISDKQLY